MCVMLYSSHRARISGSHHLPGNYRVHGCALYLRQSHYGEVVSQLKPYLSNSPRPTPPVSEHHQPPVRSVNRIVFVVVSVKFVVSGARDRWDGLGV